MAWVTGSKFSFDVVGPYIEKHNEGDISSFSAGGIAATDEAASKSKDRLDAVLVASDTTALPEKISADAGTLSYLISCSLQNTACSCVLLSMISFSAVYGHIIWTFSILLCQVASLVFFSPCSQH